MPTHVLIVEDEGIIADDIELSLRDIGYEVVGIAMSGEEAIEAAAALRPDIVLSDIHLAGELDGISAATEIREQLNLPVIYLTAYADEMTLQRAKFAAPYGYLLKPFSERELRIAIETALYKHRTEAKLAKMERWLATTLRSIGDAVIATDTEGSITFLNPVAEALTGWAESDALGRSVDEVFAVMHGTTGEALESPVACALRGESSFASARQPLLHTRAGQALPIDSSVAPIRDDDNHLTGVVVVFRDVSARNQAEERLRHYALHDQLTGLFNRTVFVEQIERAMQRARQQATPGLAVLFLDCDRFKMVNDSLGHLAGDQFLISMARRLEGCLRESDVVARLGGDEFAILLNDVSDASDAVRVAERVQAVLGAPFVIDGHEIFSSASIGIALYEPHYASPNELLRDADSALYRAKEQGRACHIVFDAAMHAQAVALLELETALRQAVVRQEFYLQYQPIMALDSGQVSGFEALLRWRQAQGEPIGPAEFIPLLEDMGLMVPLGWWVLREACGQLAHWQRRFPTQPPLTMSVNVSAKQFAQPNLVAQIARVLNDTGLDGASLRLEITESLLMQQRPGTAATFQQLRALGVRLHIDDFGTGYSSLSMLRQLPTSTLKIDRSFIAQLHEAEDAQLVATIIALAQHVQMDVIAEGVEDESQVLQLRALGCAFGQGYRFSRPLDSAAVEGVLAQQSLS